MTITLAMYTALFLLTVALSVELGFWLARRKFIDVSESFEDLRLANARSDLVQWNRLWKRLDTVPEPKEYDLSDVNEKLANLETQLSGLYQRLDSLPEPKDTDLSIVYAQLNKVHRQLTNLRDDEPVKLVKTADTSTSIDLLSETDRMPILTATEQ